MTMKAEEEKGNVIQAYTAPPEMIGIEEVRKRIGGALSYEAIRGLCKEGRIVFIRANKKYLINWQRFVEYLNTGAEAEEGVARNNSEA